jgi:ABC-2 type transport system permease protein
MTAPEPARSSRRAAPPRLAAALAARDRPARANALNAALTFAWRGLLKIKHIPEQLLDVTVTPVLFTLMFTYLFGGALAGSPQAYLQFLLPGMMVMSVLFTTVYSGVTLNTDVTKGVSDRFRSLPIWPPAPLVGAVLSDSVRYLIAAGVTLAVGLVLGYRPAGGGLGVAAGLGLLVVFAFAISWIFTTIGLLLRTPNAVMNLGFICIFPLTFMTNIFVDPATLPALLGAVVNANPITQLVSAVRSCMEGSPQWSAVSITLATSGVCTLLFAPLTLRLYRRNA